MHEPTPILDPEAMDHIDLRLPRELALWAQIQAAKRQVTRDTFMSMISIEYIEMLIAIDELQAVETEPTITIEPGTLLEGFPSDFKSATR